MNKSIRFWDRLAKRYARKPVPDEAIYQRKLEISRSYFRPQMDVMEFGCGTGSTAIAHAPHVAHILATDFSSRMIEIAKSKAVAAGIDNVDFEQSDIDDVQIADQTFHAVMGHSILHLVDDRNATIDKVFRMLRPGGVFISSTVCIGDQQKFIRLIAPIGKALGLMPMLRVFTSQDLIESLTRAGFTIDHQWLPAGSDAIFIVAKKR